jgi:hypothetical protein
VAALRAVSLLRTARCAQEGGGTETFVGYYGMARLAPLGIVWLAPLYWTVLLAPLYRTVWLLPLVSGRWCGLAGWWWVGQQDCGVVLPPSTTQWPWRSSTRIWSSQRVGVLAGRTLLPLLSTVRACFVS